MMDYKTNAERIKKLLVDHLGLEPHRVINEAMIVEDFGADSLDCVELLMAVEEEFETEINDDEVFKCKTVGDIISLIDSQEAATKGTRG